LNSFEILNGFQLVPPFDPDVHQYKTTVGESVSGVRIAISVPSHIQKYKLKLNSSRIISGEESPPIPIANGETVDLVITISAPGHSRNVYYLSIHRLEKPNIWWRIVKRCLLVILLGMLIAGILYVCFSFMRACSCFRFGDQRRYYDPINSGA